MTIQDSDITTLLDPPNSCSQRDGTLSLQVRLSHLLSFILTCKPTWSLVCRKFNSPVSLLLAIYKTEKTELGTFLEETRSILQAMAGHAQKIEGIIHSKFQNSVDTMPKGTRYTTLLYHEVNITSLYYEHS